MRLGDRMKKRRKELDFNPRTREGCDEGVNATHRIVTNISIHAPVKGATFNNPKLSMITGGISIHAPVKGATLHKRLFYL